MKVIAILAAAMGLVMQTCGGSPPPPPTVVLGDSVAAQVGGALPNAENDAVGGTTACDTASSLPSSSPQKVLLHVGGHSWGYYDAAAWQACTLRIIDTYLQRGSKVFVATAPTPMAIACGNKQLAEAAFGFPIYGDADYELRQRIEDANTWKLNTLRVLRPQVRLVDWRGFEHYGWPDCTHFTDYGISQAVNASQAAGL